MLFTFLSFLNTLFFCCLGSVPNSWRRPRRWRRLSSATSSPCTAFAATRRDWWWNTWRQALWKLYWPQSHCPGSCVSVSSMRRRWGWTSCIAWTRPYFILTLNLLTSCWTRTTTSRWDRASHVWSWRGLDSFANEVVTLTAHVLDLPRNQSLLIHCIKASVCVIHHYLSKLHCFWKTPTGYLGLYLPITHRG